MFLKLFLSKLIETCPDMARSKDLKICHPMVAAGCLCGLPGYIPKALWMWTPVNVLSFTQDHHISLHSVLFLRVYWTNSHKTIGEIRNRTHDYSAVSRLIFTAAKLSNHFSLFLTLILR